MLKQQGAYLVREPGNLNLFSEQPSIGVWERREVAPEVRVPVLRLGVKYLEKAYQLSPHGIRVELHQIVMEHVMSAKYAGILGIEAEHQTDTKDVQ